MKDLWLKCCYSNCQIFCLRMYLFMWEKFSKLSSPRGLFRQWVEWRTWRDAVERCTSQMYLIRQQIVSDVDDNALWFNIISVKFLFFTLGKILLKVKWLTKWTSVQDAVNFSETWRRCLFLKIKLYILLNLILNFSCSFFKDTHFIFFSQQMKVRHARLVTFERK